VQISVDVLVNGLLSFQTKPIICSRLWRVVSSLQETGIHYGYWQSELFNTANKGGTTGLLVLFIGERPFLYFIFVILING
jgi:hypothetical protein